MNVCGVDKLGKVRLDSVNTPLAPSESVIVSDTADDGVIVKFVDGSPLMPVVGPVSVYKARY